jgi:hypothetical protein
MIRAEPRAATVTVALSPPAAGPGPAGPGERETDGLIQLQVPGSRQPGGLGLGAAQSRPPLTRAAAAAGAVTVPRPGPLASCQWDRGTVELEHWQHAGLNDPEAALQVLRSGAGSGRRPSDESEDSPSRMMTRIVSGPLSCPLCGSLCLQVGLDFLPPQHKPRPGVRAGPAPSDRPGDGGCAWVVVILQPNRFDKLDLS